MEAKKYDFFGKIKKIKGLEFIIIGVIVFLIFVILFGESFFSGKKVSEETGADRYVSGLESKLEKTLSQVKGAGKVSVIVSVSGGGKTVIANDVKTVKNGSEIQITESPVLVGGKTVILGELYPEITGVLIVASGAQNVSVKIELVNAAASLLAIDPSRVNVLTGK
ncbi:MAG: hypothetical protein J6Z34_03390 [Clostridia bacterium]|nr:hypothetical protein [Clostridia bacterium]